MSKRKEVNIMCKENGDMTLAEWREKYPKEAKICDAIGDYCIGIYRKNGYTLSCRGCPLINEKKCHSTFMTLDELKANYKKIFKKDFEF